MQQAMKKMGLKQEEIDAIAVIIRTNDADIIIRNPSVQKINMAGNISYQVAGEEEYRRLEEEISEEDIKTVMEQAKVTRTTAEKALKDSNGELAAAILSCQNL